MSEAVDAFAGDPGLEEALLVLGGEQTLQHVRNSIRCRAKRRGMTGIKVTVADVGEPAFWLRRISPQRRLTPSQQAEIFLAVRVNGLSHRQASRRFGVPHSTVTSLVDRLSHF